MPTLLPNDPKHRHKPQPKKKKNQARHIQTNRCHLFKPSFSSKSQLIDDFPSQYHTSSSKFNPHNRPQCLLESASPPLPLLPSPSPSAASTQLPPSPSSASRTFPQAQTQPATSASSSSTARRPEMPFPGTCWPHCAPRLTTCTASTAPTARKSLPGSALAGLLALTKRAPRELSFLPVPLIHVSAPARI